MSDCAAAATCSEQIYLCFLCRFIHRETQPHTWAVSLTTSRDFDGKLPANIEGGGNFFLSRYGIRIQAASNTLIVWKPTDWHGTSLYNLNPFERTKAEFHQRGLAFVTGNRLANAIAKAETILQPDDFVHSAPTDSADHELDKFISTVSTARRSPRLLEKEEMKKALQEYREHTSG